jgi:carbon starvation protein
VFVYPIIILLIVLAIYAIAYILYGRKILEQRVVKADSSRPTPCYHEIRRRRLRSSQ